MSTVGEYLAATTIRGIDEGVGASGLVQSLHGTPRDGSLQLMTGTPGLVGPPGEQARPFRWEGDVDRRALDAIAAKLTPAQAGKAWRVIKTNELIYWNGSGFDTFTEAFGAFGPDGQPCTVRIGTVDTGPVGSDLQVTVVGTPPDLVLNLTVPRGTKGRKGEPGGPGPIRQAPDYADGTHVDRAVPTWDATTERWKPRSFPGLRGPWSIVGDTAWDGGPGFIPSQSGITAEAITLAKLNIPPLDTDWRPMIIGGGVNVRPDDGANSAANRIDLEVRIGSASGQIVALASGMPMGASTMGRLQPFYGVRGMTPSSTVGVVPAGQAITLYVVLRRNWGDIDYDYNSANAQVVCMARPVGAL